MGQLETAVKLKTSPTRPQE